MTALEEIIFEASTLPDQQLREVIAMAAGMEAANQISKEQAFTAPCF